MGEKILILKRLLDPRLKILDDDEYEHDRKTDILVLFSDDASATVATTIVSSLSGNSKQPEFETLNTINWSIHAVAYCLTLRKIFKKSLQESLQIIKKWLGNKEKNLFGDYWGVYARRLFRYTSLIFDYEIDNKLEEERKDLIIALLNDYMYYQNEFGHLFDEKTWSVLIRILIGASDHLINIDSQNKCLITASDLKELIGKCLKTLFKTIINSHLTSNEIWDIFKSFCSNDWCKIEGNSTQCEWFLDVWSNEVNFLYRSMLESIYSKSNDLTTPQKDEMEKEKQKIKWLGFHLYRFIHSINLSNILQNQKYFNILSKLIQELYNSSKIKFDNQLYKPHFPADQFFGLFGNWCFQPFLCGNDETLQNAAVIIRVLLKIAGKWQISDEWAKRCIYALIKSIEFESKQKSKLIQSILLNGHHLLKQFISEQLINYFKKAFTTYRNLDSKSENIQSISKYTTLLENISEISTIDKETIELFQKWSINSTQISLNVLTIALFQNPDKFVNYITQILQDTQGQSAYHISLFTRIMLLFASAPPFIKITCIKEFLLKIIEFVKKNKGSESLVNSFFILVASITKWNDDIFRKSKEDDSIQKELYIEIFDFFVEYKKYKNDFLNNEKIAMMMNGVIGLLLGRSVDRSHQIIKNEVILVHFLIGDSTIVSVLGDKKRSDSFVVHVREPRGFFIWKLSDVLEKGSFRRQIDSVDSLPDTEKTREDSIDCDYDNVVEIDQFKDMINQINNSNVHDQDFTKPSNHADKTYIAMHDDKWLGKSGYSPIRHKFIDFLIQTQLSNNIYKFDECELERSGTMAKKLIDEYDSIAAVPKLNVQLFYFPNDFPQNDDSPLFKRFIALISSNQKNSENVNPEVKMGLFDIQFTKNAQNEDKDLSIGILFNECPLVLNKKHKDIPNCNLLFFVTPHDSLFYKVHCICNNNFECTIPRERMVSTKNLAAVISMSIFSYVSFVKPDFIFSKNEERKDFLRKIPKSKVTPLEIANLFSEYTKTYD
ncbi:hypothetical protein TRFO_11497 [Tritrichomonas foetus]|uniref:Ral GTPase-activating protein subunit alpha/beta N-terminal domain-containing protein n=1 Tax=Tritrichomonas foetus TaxID=1144522 RepID=A0A1J4J3H0_9EUKA|nr:hypothetical protein TRFO_11497 [Tritrichomonas foetus]|eukprot:OHS94000.1 hypothetical protein TRFO_11497 [Tritrichomonas foetus]